MKILHTSDWHLGHTLYGYDRTEEYESMLGQVEAIVSREKPDLFLLSGDVFDVAQPSASVQKMFVDALVRLRLANPEMKIAVTAGNHDSGTRHEVFREPWSALGVETIGRLHGSDPERHIIELPGKGWLVAVPFAHSRHIPEGFISRLLESVEERNSGGLPVVVAAHTTVKGADYTGHSSHKKGEEDYIVGGIDTVEIGSFGTAFDYLALGHIHRPQFVHSGIPGAHHNVRYSGSPIAVSFDEPYEHTVSLVEIAARGSATKVREEKIENPWPLLTLPSSGPTDWETALDQLREFPATLRAYIRLNVEQERPLPASAHDTALHAAKDKALRFCHINYRRTGGSPASDRGRIMTVEQFRKVAPEEIARRHIESLGHTFGEEMAEMLREVMERL